MEVKATLKYLRMAPRKVRLVVDVIKGMPAEKAVTTLAFMNKRAAEPVLKLVESAIANAKHNHQIMSQNLVVKAILVNEGPTLHRYMPRAFGRAGSIKKRSSHVILTLDEVRSAQSKTQKENQEKGTKEELSSNLVSLPKTKKNASSKKVLKPKEAKEKRPSEIIDQPHLAHAHEADMKHSEKQAYSEKKKTQRRAKIAKNKE